MMWGDARKTVKETKHMSQKLELIESDSEKEFIELFRKDSEDSISINPA